MEKTLDTLQAIANDCRAWLDGDFEISGEDLIQAILSACVESGIEPERMATDDTRSNGPRRTNADTENDRAFYAQTNYPD